MINPGVFKVDQTNRLYMPLLKGLGGMTAVSYAALSVHGQGIEGPSSGCSMCSAVYDYEISYTPKNWLHDALTHNWPPFIELNIVNAARVTPVFDPNNTFMQLYIGPLESAYCIYYENRSDEIISKYGGKKNLPPHIQFCRIIRNGIAHGNRINITDGIYGELNGLKISDLDNGKSLTYDLVTQADYIFMMILLDRE